MREVEYHPLEPFLPANAKLLMLGSFPPKRERWSMDFFYPNFQNDMWRIFGIVFFDNKEHFLIKDKKSFKQNDIEAFLIEKGIAIFDIAQAVIRHKDNASDNFLEIVEKSDLNGMLQCLTDCMAVVTTGQKASEALSESLSTDVPKIANSSEFIFRERAMRFYRMPSSSRAYPLNVDRKAEMYKQMFRELDML